MAKAPAKKDEKKPEAEVEGEGEQPKKKSKLPLIIGLVVLLAAGGGATWFFVFKGKGEGEQAAQQQAKPQPLKPPVFVPLDAFTVNLTTEQGDQYLQVAATLKVLDQAAADVVKQYMPEVRHRTLTLISSKKPSQIASAEGRERLAEEMRQTANNILLAAAGKPVKPVVLDVPKADEETPSSAEAKPTDEPAKPEEAKPQEGMAPAADAATAAPAAAPAPPPAAAKSATTLSKAAADDPVQSVYFTSFIIQ
ncbi:MAG: flagellar basal body-associated FliL family protein [Rhodocyclaceae bacterium]|nr:flagellar basal body-associated FliL family protein [Rhodocyclaceae bacterium]